MTAVKKLVFTAMCIALSVLLPMAFHSVPRAGSVFLPMHIPVFLCGLLCGGFHGLLCGLLAPLLSSLLTGMPSAVYAPVLMGELAVYGLISGVLARRVRTGKPAADLYISLIAAMICGRIVSGLLKALIFNVGRYSLHLWLTASFVTALPGIVIQLIVIPLVIGVLYRAKLAARSPQ